MMRNRVSFQTKQCCDANKTGIQERKCQVPILTHPRQVYGISAVAAFLLEFYNLAQGIEWLLKRNALNTFDVYYVLVVIGSGAISDLQLLQR